MSKDTELQSCFWPQVAPAGSRRAGHALGWRAALALCVLALALAGGVAPGAHAAEPWQDWRSPLMQDHPLAGRIWSAREGRELSASELVEALAPAHFVLLGEVHDNPDHHRLQAWVMDRLSSAGRKPAVIMEMIAQDKADALAAYLADDAPDSQGLREALDWDQSGWPAWEMYSPIAEVALAAGLRIVPGSPPREMVAGLSRGRLDALGERRLNELALSNELSAPLSAALADELYAGHCEMIPREAMAPMAAVQRFRDAVMADALIGALAGANSPAANSSSDGGILIAGGGHVRLDRAVPWYLRQRTPEHEAAALIFIEVDAQASDPGDLVPVDPEGRPAVDFVWYTPRAERGDPCEQLREMFRRPPRP